MNSNLKQLSDILCVLGGNYVNFSDVSEYVYGICNDVYHYQWDVEVQLFSNISIRFRSSDQVAMATVDAMLRLLMDDSYLIFGFPYISNTKTSAISWRFGTAFDFFGSDSIPLCDFIDQRLDVVSYWVS